MSRGMDALNKAAVGADVVAPIHFADLDFSSGHVRVHSAVGTITWGGYDWLGVCTFGTVTGLEEKAELSRKTVTYTLSGVPNDLIAVVLGEDYQGRSAKIYVGLMSTTTFQLVADPELLDSGSMDISDIDEGATCSVSITAESRISAWSRPMVRRYTDAEQQSRYPGDLGLEFLSQAVQKEIVWGRKT